MSNSRKSVLLVGNGETIHLGHHYLEAAGSLGVQAELLDVRDAKSSIPFLDKIAWRLREKRPARLPRFQRQVLSTFTRFRPRLVLFLGNNFVEKDLLQALKVSGATTGVFLSDNPWNPLHRTSWFLESLPLYDFVFNPRSEVESELLKVGCARVHRVAFGYSPSLHFPAVLNAEEQPQYESDLLFFGGADSDRIPYLDALIRAGIRPRLYGGYWDQHPVTRPFAAGMGRVEELPKLVAGAKVCLNLVREANRDGHVMRSFELPAMNACVLAQRTPDHLEYFGEQSLAYFDSLDSLVRQTKHLLENSALRKELSKNALARVRSGHHSYADRLGQVLSLV